MFREAVDDADDGCVSRITDDEARPDGSATVSPLVEPESPPPLPGGDAVLLERSDLPRRPRRTRTPPTSSSRPGGSREARHADAVSTKRREPESPVAAEQKRSPRRPPRAR